MAYPDAPLPQPPQPQEEVEAQLGNARIRVRSSDIIGGATLAAVFIIGALLWNHLQDTNKDTAAFVAALHDQTVAVKEQTVAAREQTCLMRFDQNERPKNAEFCKTISR